MRAIFLRSFSTARSYAVFPALFFNDLFTPASKRISIRILTFAWESLLFGFAPHTAQWSGECPFPSTVFGLRPFFRKYFKFFGCFHQIVSWTQRTFRHLLQRVLRPMFRWPGRMCKTSQTLGWRRCTLWAPTHRPETDRPVGPPSVFIERWPHRQTTA